jgi:hypothetical protein
MNGWMIAVVVVGLIVLVIFISMIPELRRYFRMRRM